MSNGTESVSKARLVICLVLIWIALFALSFVIPFSQEATGDGFTRGLNRVGSFLIWQGSAFVVAIVTLLIGFRPLYAGSRRLSRVPAIVHTLAILLAAGAIYFASRQAAQVEPYTPPRAVTAPATDLTTPPAPADSSSAPSVAARQFNGIYRSGFEASHFYTMDGEGPWWLEADAAAQAQIDALYVDGPGRSGGVTAALTVTGWLEDAGDEFTHLGIVDYRIRVTSIEGIRGLSADEFELVLDTITRR